MERTVLARKQLTELKDIAASLEMRGYQRLKKAELVEAITQATNGGSKGGGGEQGGANGAAAPAAPAAPRTRVRPGAEAEHGDEPRVRVRTRTRERGGDGDMAESAEASQAAPAPAPAPAPAAAEQPRAESGGESEARQDSGGGERQQRPERQRQGGGQGGQGGGQGQGQRNQQNQQNQDGSRRNRRERRRKGGQGGGGQGQGGGSQHQHQQQRQNRPVDDDPNAEPGEIRVGVLDILPEGYGFLRTTGYLPGERDVYISQSVVRRHGLRRGDVVEGPIRQQKANEKVPALHSVQTVNGIELDENGQLPHRPDFKDMTPLFPEERLGLETPDGPISMRIVDLMAPIGKGQRGLIVSPPKAGKTTILKELGQAIAYNNPECHLMVVLVDERPEEVTDMQRSIPGEVVASTFDRPADDHTQIAELAMERAKRLVEMGHDVVVLLDSITRLARAYNLSAPASGRIMSGGVDSSALYPPKKFFGAARNIEHGGSLTIIASALIETGSKMDEVIFEEFKGTGNMELRLDRRLEQKRIFPAIDIEASGTRKEELLLDKEELTLIWKLRRVLHALEGPGAIELLIDKMKQTRSNNQFLLQIQKTNLQS
jgi:transcription termination factor Rho